MGQFDVYRNPQRSTAQEIPYLVDLQSDRMSTLRTRVIAPLEVRERVRPATRLNPAFQVEGRSVVLSIADLASVRRDYLGEPIASLAEHRYDFIAALDMLITGI